MIDNKRLTSNSLQIPLSTTLTRTDPLFVEAFGRRQTAN
jgi:hypothetical protein